MTDRYTARRGTDGTWSVIDTLTDRPAMARERLLICMPSDGANDAVEFLNMIELWKYQRRAMANYPDGVLGSALLDPLRGLQHLVVNEKAP